MNIELEIKRSEIERDEDWEEINTLIPAIDFSSIEDISIKIMAPRMGAIARFRVICNKNADNWVSVYLDWHGRLGCVEQPYYEIYPIDEEGVERYFLSEIEKMVSDIKGVIEGGRE